LPILITLRLSLGFFDSNTCNVPWHGVVGQLGEHLTGAIEWCGL